MSLRDILKKYYRPVGVAGATHLRDALLADLRRHYRFNVRMHVAVLSALVVSLVLIVSFVIAHMPIEKKDLPGVIAALAALLAASLELVRRVTREWSQARLMEVVVRSIPDDQLPTMIGKLLDPTKSP